VTKITKIALIVGILMIPAFAGAAGFAVGGRIDQLSSGIEFRMTFPVAENTDLFIAPNGFGTYYFSNSGDNGFLNVGLRTGIMFLTDRWISPYVGIGGGYYQNANSYSNQDPVYTDSTRDIEHNFGGRGFFGLSVTPFRLLSGDIEWLKPLDGLRFEFDMGLEYLNYYDYSYEAWTHDTGFGGVPVTEIRENTRQGQNVVLPDFGVGVVFGW
jgi:hypothetical protein